MRVRVTIQGGALPSASLLSSAYLSCLKRRRGENAKELNLRKRLRRWIATQNRSMAKPGGASKLHFTKGGKLGSKRT